MDITIRDAAEADLPGIMDIYNDAVANTTAIWNEAVVDLENRKAWFTARRERGFAGGHQDPVAPVPGGGAVGKRPCQRGGGGQGDEDKGPFHREIS